MRTTLARIPTPLALILPVVALFGCCWALVVPAWQMPDETSHFAYVQAIGESGRLPGAEGRPAWSQELVRSANATNVQPTIFFPFADPEWAPSRERDWYATDERWSRTNAGGPSSASSYPPLYYGYESIFYTAAKRGDIFTRLTVLRLGSLLWLLVTVAGAWLLAAELFRRNLPRLLTAASVGLWPMITFVSASVNPDAALFAWWTLILWMGVRIAMRGLTPRRALALGGFVAAGILTKAATLAILPSVFALVAWGVWRSRSQGWTRALASGGAAFGAIAVPVALWTFYAPKRSGYAQVSELGTTGSSGLNYMEFFSYLWQFYLPKLGFMTDVQHHVPVISDLPVLNTWIGTGTGVFGWVNVWLPKWIYLLVAAIVVAVAAFVVVKVVREARRRPEAGRFAAAIFLAGTALITIAAVHWTDYRFYADDRGLFAQGRYLLPLGALAAACLAWALDSLPRRLRLPASGAWLGALVALQLASLSLAATRWYA